MGYYERGRHEMREPPRRWPLFRLKEKRQA